MSEPEITERLTSVAKDAGMRLHVRSALNPLLWLCAICSPLSFSLSFFSEGILQILFFLVGALPIVCACGAYIYWMVKAPNRLHSEDYQLRRQALEMIHEKGVKVGVLANSVVAITNPNLPRRPEELQ
jgi:hypothetical protein